MKFNIENYEKMTTEEKLAALEAYEPDMSGYVTKAQFDKTASEAAGYKKQLKEKMSEEERAKAEQAEEKLRLETRVKELEQAQAISQYVNSYVALGYSEELAKSTAKAIVENDMSTVIANQKAFTEQREKAIKADLLKGTPAPARATDSSVTVTKEQFKKMSYREMSDLYDKNPELYKELIKG